MVVVTATSWNVVISPVEPEPMGPAVSPVVVTEKVAKGVEERV